MRTPILAANWKMHKTGAQAKEFISKLAPRLGSARAKIWIAPPFTALLPSIAAVTNSPIVIGAQNMHEDQEGAFTGEISAPMLKEAGARFVILGHSERRRLFHETDAQIQQKVKGALSSGLTPLLCVGETQEERDSGQTEKVLLRQLEQALQGLPPSEIVLAYEPIWAIGTGKTATPELAGQAHAVCRKYLAKKWDKSAADKICILYGGSVTPQTISSLIREEDIDGALIGGAALDVESFNSIIQGIPS